jgi:hypothetical protein
MLFSEPKWGNGCLALLAGVAGFFLIASVVRFFGWSVPRPVATLLQFLLVLAIARFILNQIFD